MGGGVVVVVNVAGVSICCGKCGRGIWVPTQRITLKAKTKTLMLVVLNASKSFITAQNCEDRITSFSFDKF